MPSLVVACDIDGVITDVRDLVSKYLPHDWDSYFSHTSEVLPIEPITLLLESLMKDHHEVVFITGRPEPNRKATEKWLRNHIDFPDEYKPRLFMRPNGESRPTYKLKLLWCKEIEPDLILEDEPRAIEALQKEKFLVLQVHGFRITEKDGIPPVCTKNI